MADLSIFYTDGSCKLELGTYAWAWSLGVQGDIHDSGAGEAPGRCNNKAELEAVVQALQYAVENKLFNVRVITDSTFVMNNDKWGETWKKNGWRISNGQPCAEAKLSEAFLNLRQTIKDSGGCVEFVHIPGHSGDPGNNYVDELAGLAREQYEVDHKLVTVEACPKILAQQKRKQYTALEFMKTVAGEELPESILCWRYKGIVYSRSKSVRTYHREGDVSDTPEPLKLIAGIKQYETDAAGIPSDGGISLFPDMNTLGTVMPDTQESSWRLSQTILRASNKAVCIGFFVGGTKQCKKAMYMGVLTDGVTSGEKVLKNAVPLFGVPDIIPTGVMFVVQCSRLAAMREALKEGMSITITYVHSLQNICIRLIAKDTLSGIMFMPTRGMTKVVTCVADGLTHRLEPSTTYVHQYSFTETSNTKEDDMSDSEAKQCVVTGPLDTAVSAVQEALEAIQKIPEQYASDKESGKALITVMKGLIQITEMSSSKQRKILNSVIKSYGIGKEPQKDSNAGIIKLLQEAAAALGKK